MILAAVADVSPVSTFASHEFVLRGLRQVSAESKGPAFVRCEIRPSLFPDGLRLDAVAAARKEVAVTYEFEVMKNSLSGSSQNMQTGQVRLSADPRVFSTVVLDRSAMMHYKATLILKWNGERMSCSAP